MPKAVIVLGKRLKDDGSPTDSLTTRMATACKVFKEKCKSEDFMFVTGGRPANSNQRPVAEVMKNLVLGEEFGRKFDIHPENGECVTCRFDGVDDKQVVIEGKARSTIESAFLIREHLIEKKITDVFLVTDDYHMRRAYFIFNYVMAIKIDSRMHEGITKSLAGLVNGKGLNFPVDERLDVSIKPCPNVAPICPATRKAELDFEDTLPNDQILKTIKMFTFGIQEATIGANAADKLHAGGRSKLMRRTTSSENLGCAPRQAESNGQADLMTSLALPGLWKDRPKEKRAVVALGKRLKDDGKPTDVLTSRMSTACRAFREHCTGLDDLMIVTGGKPADLPRSEAEVMRDLATGRELGKHAVHITPSGDHTTFEFHGPEERQIVLEDKARTTLENAFMIREKLERNHVTEIILVTDDFHMRRSHFIFDYVMHKEISPEEKKGLEKVLEPTLKDPRTGIPRPLELSVNTPFRCKIEIVENCSPIPEELKQSEHAFEATLPNSKMMDIIEKVKHGVPEVIGGNKSDNMHGSDAKKSSKVGHLMLGSNNDWLRRLAICCH